MSATAEEIKNLIEDQNKAWKDFRAENDRRLKEVEKNGAASATTIQNVTALNTRMDEISEKLKKAQEQSATLEAAVNRLNLGGMGEDRQADLDRQVELFNSVMGRGERNQATREDYVNYRKALNTYIRRGEQAMTPELRNALSVGEEKSGGYWVLPDTSGPMVKKVFETSPMRALATVVNITSDRLVGIIDNEEVTTGWGTERTTPTETTSPDIGKYEIQTWTQWAEPRATQQLLDDAGFNAEAWLQAKIDDKLGRTENAAFVTGNGSGRPRGFLDYSKVTTADATRAWNALQYIATGVSGAFDTVANNGADKLLDVVYALKTSYRASANWFGSRSTIGVVRKLKDGQGNYLWAPGSASQPATLHGYPIAEGEDMPVVAANSYSLAFGDFKSAYIIVDRLGRTVLRDPYTAKPFVKFYCTKRVGGGLVNGEAIKLLKFGVS